MNKKLIPDEIKSYLGIILGIIIYSFSVAAFLIPAKLVSGGFGGIGTIIFFITNKNGHGIPVGISYLILNVIVLFIAYRRMGWKFVKLSIFGVIATSVMLIIMQKFITKALVPDQPFMNAIIGGALGGFGLGITFNSGGNTGGTDIISLIINKYRDVSPGRISLYCNLFVIIAMYFVFFNIETVVYGIVVMAITSYSLDVMLNGHRQSYQFLVMSSKYEEIANTVVNDLGRGVTVLDGQGWYTKKESKVLMIIANRTDKNKLLRIIKKIDSNAFLSVSRIEAAFGKNFDRIKS